MCGSPPQGALRTRDIHAIQRPATARHIDGDACSPVATRRVSRYDIWHVEIFSSARRHGIADDDITHAVEHALAVGEQDDGKVLYLGPDRAGNLPEVVSVVRDDGSEVVIHAMRMRARYEPFLRGEGGSDV